MVKVFTFDFTSGGKGRDLWPWPLGSRSWPWTLTSKGQGHEIWLQPLGVKVVTFDLNLYGSWPLTFTSKGQGRKIFPLRAKVMTFELDLWGSRLWPLTLSPGVKVVTFDLFSLLLPIVDEQSPFLTILLLARNIFERITSWNSTIKCLLRTVLLAFLISYLIRRYIVYIVFFLVYFLSQEQIAYFLTYLFILNFSECTSKAKVHFMLEKHTFNAI